MAGIMTTAGLASRAAYAGTTQQWLNTLTAFLFVNDRDPVVTDAMSDYDLATFPGYADIPWNTWGAGALDGNNNRKYDATRLTFLSTGVSADTVYGYGAKDGAGSLCLVEKNGVGVDMSAAGLTYYVDGHFYEGQTNPPL